MAYIEPAQVVTGQPITAETWNQDVVNNTLALYNSPGVGFTYGLATSVLQAENTVVRFPNSDAYNNGITVDRGENKLTVQIAGVYAIHACVIQSSTTTSANNGSLYAQTSDGIVVAVRTYQHAAVGGGTSAQLNIFGTKKMVVGDFVQFFIRQNLIASLDFQLIAGGMHWIGSGA